MNARLTINARFLTQPQSGVQRYAFNLLGALDRLLQKDAMAEAIGPIRAFYPAGAALEARPDWRFIRLEPLPCRFGAGHIWEQTALARAARGSYLLNLTGSGPLRHKDQLLVIHDANIWQVPEAFSRPYRAFHKAIRPVLARRARDLATVSQFSATELAGVLGLPELRFRVIPNGSDHLASAPDAEAVLARMGLTKNGFFLAVGNLSPNKNLSRLIEAMAQAETSLPLVIAGANAPGLKQADPAGDTRHTRFLGRVDDEELAALYAGAQAFLWPPLREGFGIPPLEAMRFGTPVLSSNSTAMPEVLDHAPLYFDPLDTGAMARTIRAFADMSPKAKDEMVIAGYKRASRFTWDTSARMLGDLLLRRCL